MKAREIDKEASDRLVQIMMAELSEGEVEGGVSIRRLLVGRAYLNLALVALVFPEVENDDVPADQHEYGVIASVDDGVLIFIISKLAGLPADIEIRVRPGDFDTASPWQLQELMVYRGFIDLIRRLPPRKDLESLREIGLFRIFCEPEYFPVVWDRAWQIWEHAPRK